MLTIKHIQFSGEEMIYASPIANYTPSSTPATLWIEPVGNMPAGTRMPLTGGTCYVMNDNGKTVSRYDMGCCDPNA